MHYFEYQRSNGLAGLKPTRNVPLMHSIISRAVNPSVEPGHLLELPLISRVQKSVVLEKMAAQEVDFMALYATEAPPLPFLTPPPGFHCPNLQEFYKLELATFHPE